MGKSELQEACEDKGITITSVHVALETHPDTNHWRDRWSCTLHYNGKSATFDYWMGIGNRVLGPGWKVDGPSKWYHTGSGEIARGYGQAVAKGALVLKRIKVKGEPSRLEGPSVADVVRGYLDESRACSTTFDDWCSDLGENNDSIKALNTYLTCQREGTKLLRLLGHALADELIQKEH